MNSSGKVNWMPWPILLKNPRNRKMSNRMVEQQSSKSVLVRRTFPTTPERLFAAWTEPALLAQWWGPPGSKISSVEVDLRVGGSYRIGLSYADNRVFFVRGIYVEIQPPLKLAFTWRWERPDMDIGESRVTLEFQKKGKSTEIFLTHTQLPDEAARSAHEEGWLGILDNLAKMLAAK
jgi:uncharacterized protein YndB with AHSA1/START domain